MSYGPTPELKIEAVHAGKVFRHSGLTRRGRRIGARRQDGERQAGDSHGEDDPHVAAPYANLRALLHWQQRNTTDETYRWCLSLNFLEFRGHYLIPEFSVPGTPTSEALDSRSAPIQLQCG